VADAEPNPGVLAGLRILEVGHYVAAPFCTRLLGDLGAEIIKVEPPGGDPVRKWGEQVDGHSLWWSMHGRNKRSIVIDMKSERGRDLIAALARKADALVENLRPGQLDRLGLSAETLRAGNPRLVLARISGYGQTGPYRDRAAFGVIGEAIGGLRHLTNHAPGVTDLPPVRVGVSIGDSIAGLYAAFGVVAALWARDRDERAHDVDVALSESVLSMMEGMLPEYGRLGKIKAPTGGAIATAAPSNAYPSADGGWVLIAANSDPLFARLCDLMGRPSLARDERFQDNPGRVRHAAELDAMIAAWTTVQDSADMIAALEAADIPNSKIYTAEDCAADEQYLFRDMVREVRDPLIGTVLQSGIVPYVPTAPGTVRWTGQPAGAQTDDILRGILGLGPEDIASLRDDKVVQ